MLYDFDKVIFDPEQYTYLNDNIIFDIQMSSDPRLAKAKELIKRLKRRDFYPYVCEVIIPSGPNGKQLLKKATEKAVVEFAS